MIGTAAKEICKETILENDDNLLLKNYKLRMSNFV